MSDHTVEGALTLPYNVLLADDDPVFRLMMRQFLQKHDYRIWEAGDGQEAMRIFADHPVDIVVLDGDMPVMNGFDACEQIIQHNENMPVLIVTAHDDHASIDQAFAAGAADYIQKPIHWQLLLHRLNYLVRIGREGAERQRREIEMRKLTSALDQAGCGVLITDSQGVIEYVNQAFTSVTGYTLEDVIGENPRILQSGKQDEAFYQQMWQMIHDQNEWEGILQNRRKDGKIYTERLHIRALYDDSNHLCNFVGVFSDISDELAMEEQFRQSQKMAAIGTLVGGIAHNFNNMLAGINGRAEVVKINCRNMTYNPPEKAKVMDGMDKIIDTVMEAGEMVQCLLTYARKGFRHREEVDLSLMFPRAVDFAKNALPESIVMTTAFCSRSMMASVDAQQLQQVVLNLISNACDAVKGKGEKSISVRLQYRPSSEVSGDFYHRHPNIQAANFAVFQVEDNGIGIASAHLSRIFEPFFTTKEVGEGTGLGLSMAIGAAEDHGGTLEVCSKPSAGSTFSLWIPVDKSDNPTITNVVDISHSFSPSEGETLLLVDDNIMVRDTTQELLESLDVQVMVASDGDEAVEIFARHHDAITAVVSDVVMPNMNGTIAVAKMRAIQPSLPVVFITGFDKKEVDVDQQYQHITQVLTKPFKIDALLGTVRTILAHSAHRK